MERRIKRQDTRRASTVLFVSLNKKIKNVWVHLNCTVHWAQSIAIQAIALSTQYTTNLEHSHALSTQCRLTWQALALSATDLSGIKVQVRASWVVLTNKPILTPGPGRMAQTPQVGTGDSVSRFRRCHCSTVINYDNYFPVHEQFYIQLLFTT